MIVNKARFAGLLLWRTLIRDSSPMRTVLTTDDQPCICTSSASVAEWTPSLLKSQAHCTQARFRGRHSTACGTCICSPYPVPIEYMRSFHHSVQSASTDRFIKDHHSTQTGEDSACAAFSHHSDRQREVNSAKQGRDSSSKSASKRSMARPV